MVTNRQISVSATIVAFQKNVAVRDGHKSRDLQKCYYSSVSKTKTDQLLARYRGQTKIFIFVLMVLLSTCCGLTILSARRVSRKVLSLCPYDITINEMNIY